MLTERPCFGELAIDAAQRMAAVRTGHPCRFDGLTLGARTLFSLAILFVQLKHDCILSEWRFRKIHGPADASSALHRLSPHHVITLGMVHKPVVASTLATTHFSGRGTGVQTSTIPLSPPFARVFLAGRILNHPAIA